MTTTFDTRAGTRGASTRFPRAFRWLDRQMSRPAARQLFTMVGMGQTLVLTTVGRRSGVERSVRLCCFPSEGGGWLVVAAAGGTASNPAWYHNVAAHPDDLWIEVDGRRVAVTAEQLHGQQREAAWRQVTATSRQFAGFQRKTDRELPVIRLLPRPAPGTTQD
ncbi:nitroreductase/quinone reductase family protein [Intrasporangium sp. DVR]|uniref:nitroreductase/quinone reductase family protein n=1 Tax=Intrasporangium sp. DVR TaxID=3127867 RepID=UPI00313A6ABA